MIEHPPTAPVAVITGASRGLGLGIAERLLRAGWSVGACARTVPELPGGHEARTVCRAVDVGDAAALDRFASEVVEAFGPIDLWVNNAGVLEPVGPHRDVDPAEVASALIVNVGGVSHGTQSFTRRARRWPPRSDGRRRVLVNISSGAARSSYAGWAVYGATKAAVDHLTEIIAVEEPDLVCHAVAPGVVDTGMQAQIRTYDEERFPSVARFQDLHRTGAWNSPAWVADHLLGLVAGTWTPDTVVVRLPDEPR